MINTTLCNITMLCAIGGAYVGVQYLEEHMESHHYEYDQIEQNLKDEKFAAIEASRNFAARYTCGNAPYRWVDDKTLVCTPRKAGKPYSRAVQYPPAAAAPL
jgi:NADH:ubiquinone oxidoreductase subunit E